MDDLSGLAPAFGAAQSFSDRHRRLAPYRTG